MHDSSNAGETTFIREYFRSRGRRRRQLVDVGAYGCYISNTWGLCMEGGWDALLVDANPERIPLIHAEFPMRVTVVNCAVGGEDGTATLRIHNRVGSSSILASWEPEGATGRVFKVSMLSCRSLLRNYGIPYNFDLFQVDAEGMDRVIVEDMLKRPVAATVDFRRVTHVAVAWRIYRAARLSRAAKCTHAARHGILRMHCAEHGRAASAIGVTI